MHGLDPVWSRIAGEGILKEFQRSRLEGLVDRLWREPTRLHEQEVRFAELLDQKLERKQVIFFLFFSLLLSFKAFIYFEGYVLAI